MQTRILLLCIAILSGISQIAIAQEEEPKYGITFSGYVKNDFILDTRQTISVREGHFLLYPANELLDADGEDINARASFNYLSIQSRVTGKITGPDAFGAKTSGVMEGAFFGATNSDINGFRLRHAFMKLNWSSTELLLGQYWHMMFITGCFPGTVSFNTGVPFQYFSRNPQIRITQQLGNFTIAGMVATQRDFSSPGGSVVLRNALLPDLKGQITYEKGNLFAGLSAGYKKIVPRIQTDSLFKTSAGVGGLSGQAFMRINTAALTYKFQATYLENGYDGLSIGGFALREIIDPEKNIHDYTTINTANFWFDIHTNGKNIQLGLFGGYSKNLGSREVIENLESLSTYSRGSNIARVYRLSPRIIVNSGKARFSFELEHTGAEYGASINEKAMPEDLKMIVNNRFLVAAYYFF